MLGGLARSVLGAVSLASHRWQARAFAEAVKSPQRTQHALLKRFLAANAGTVVGRRHGYAGVSSFGDFQAKVPVSSWESLAPDVDRIAGGEQGVLSADEVTHFERTSGSTSGPKLIPYTRSLIREFHLGVGAWFADLARAHPGLWGLQQYWSLSQAVARNDRTHGGLRIGIEDDTEYLSAAARWATQQVMAVPHDVSKERTPDRWRARTLQSLLAARDLGFVSVWSPSFFTVLLEALEKQLPELLPTQAPPRRAELERGLAHHGRLTVEALWPRLRVISCWADASAKLQLPGLQRFVTTTPIQPKGVVATEGMISLPIDGVGGVAAASGHVLEFVDVESPTATPLEVGALREGGVYSVLLTTGNGFARYQLHDALRCLGHHGQLPVLRFEGRLDKTADLVGEKVTAAEVERALQGIEVPFRLVVPEAGPPARYRLYIEASPAAADAAARALEGALHRNPQYRDARGLGQLEAVSAVPVHDGWRKYVAHLMHLGLKQGDIKPAALDTRAGWAEALR